MLSILKGRLGHNTAIQSACTQGTAKAIRHLKEIVPTRGYHSNIVDHYENPRNVGSLDKGDINVGTGLVGAPACGDVMKLQIQVEEGVIKEARFKTFGCGSAIAASSTATEWIKGKTLEEAKQLNNSDIAAYLKLPPVKLHCSMLAEDAIKSAINDLENKKKGLVNNISTTPGEKIS